MAINKKLIHFETLTKFQSADGINTTSATQSADANLLVGNIPYHSIVFIKDVCKFWTHGKYYDCNNTWRGIQNNLTSTSTTDSLSAYQGKILNEKFANYLPLSGGTLTGALTVPSLTVTGASTFSQAINGSILGNAATASRLENARTISLTGSVTGSGSFDGSGNLSIATTTNHSHSYVNTIGKDGKKITWSINGTAQTALDFSTTFAPYNADGYLPLSGGTMTGNINFPVASAAYDSKGITWNDSVIIGCDTANGLGVYAETIYLRPGSRKGSSSGKGLVINTTTIQYNGNTVWHAGNDGSGSGLDADLLDGQHGSYYATASSLSDYVTLTGTQTISGNKTFSSSVSIDDLTAGNLVVTGAASFAQTINGNVATANKVNHTLTFTGYSTGTFDGSADKSIAIPSNTNQLTNGAGFITASSNITGTAAGITGYTFKSGITNTANSGWTNTSTDDKIIPTMNFIAYWNGAYNSGGSSNLTYCCKGAFGTATTHAHTDYVTSISYDSTNKKLQLSKGGGTATDIVTFGSNAFNSTAYLPLGGNSTSSPITGIIYIDNVSGPYINSHNTDLDVWHVVGNAGSWSSQYGFNLQYKGSDSGNNNDLILWAHNETGTHAEVYRVHQNGTFIFKSTPYVGSNTVMLSNHAANGITSTNITNWNSVYTWYTTAAGTSASGVIDNWNEIKNFIDGFHESDDLAEYLVNTFVAKTGGTMTGALTTPSLTVTGAATFSLAINGSILGNAATASRLQNARTISLTGSVTGSGSFDGSGNLSISTTTNHSHSYVNTIGISGSKLTWSINGTALTAIQLPTYTNNVTSHLRAGAQNGTDNATSATSDPYLLLVEGSTLDSLIQLKASTGISISANGGIVTITNTSTNSHTYTSTWTSKTDNVNYPIAFSPNATPATSGNGYNADFTFNPSTKTFNNNGSKQVYDSTNKVLKFIFD